MMAPEFQSDCKVQSGHLFLLEVLLYGGAVEWKYSNVVACGQISLTRMPWDTKVVMTRLNCKPKLGQVRISGGDYSTCLS